MQARNEDAQLALAAGIGQRRMPQVIVEVDLLGDLEAWDADDPTPRRAAGN